LSENAVAVSHRIGTTFDKSPSSRDGLVRSQVKLSEEDLVDMRYQNLPEKIQGKGSGVIPGSTAFHSTRNETTQNTLA
jgi:hypothetical protein